MVNRASDIHIDPVSNGFRVRYRIDGMLVVITILDHNLGLSLINVIKTLSEMDVANRRSSQDGSFSHRCNQGDDSDLDIRVSTLPCAGEESTVLRLLPKQTAFSKIETLGLTHQGCDIYRRWLALPQGMVICTDPTGRAKAVRFIPAFKNGLLMKLKLLPWKIRLNIN